MDIAVSMNSAHDSINGSSAFVINTSTIYIVGVPCHNLNGIEAFVNLTNLTCGMCNLDSIHIFPTSLRYAQLSYNKLRSLPTLPNNLLSLDCSNNSKLKTLPSLPNTLGFLNCMVDSLTSLPNLPTSLTDLYCGSNSLKSLPNLPSTLSFLDCSVNSISTIPSIPTNLKQLICSNNQLTQLPTLNFGLKDLECQSNPITCFPKLPSTLDSLRYNNTLISCIPNYVSIKHYCSPLLSTLPICNHTNTNTCPIICIKHDTINKTICGNQLYSFHNQTLTQSGTYHDTLQNYLGCDSIITLNLTVNNCGSNGWYAVPDTNFQKTLITLGYASSMNLNHDSINSFSMNVLGWKKRRS